MIEIIRDGVTVAVFAAVIGGLIVHTIRLEFSGLFSAGKSPRVSAKRKFQGSASVWVK